ncbi:MAG: hypothetical protein EZS28_005555 [Streblomastix strix]|uniref:Uncharacterized protein n=1 Tax=Streblomastix strix TaxID=222440 RepID=A0A5J4WWJ7_9EUKA|nr:MAG: hypothetical protein EZS28_005555 [Streblomastix strix]
MKKIINEEEEEVLLMMIKEGITKKEIKEFIVFEFIVMMERKKENFESVINFSSKIQNYNFNSDCYYYKGEQGIALDIEQGDYYGYGDDGDLIVVADAEANKNEFYLLRSYFSCVARAYTMDYYSSVQSFFVIIYYSIMQIKTDTIKQMKMEHNYCKGGVTERVYEGVIEVDEEKVGEPGDFGALTNLKDLPFDNDSGYLICIQCNPEQWP